MNKKTKALTTEQYKEIIQTMREGFCGCRPNERIATALMLEANLGIRISDILKLRLADIVRDGDRYRLEVVEQKTGKRRIFTVPLVLLQYIENYCLRNGIGHMEVMFPITERMIQKQLHQLLQVAQRENILQVTIVQIVLVVKYLQEALLRVVLLVRHINMRQKVAVHVLLVQQVKKSKQVVVVANQFLVMPVFI